MADSIIDLTYFEREPLYIPKGRTVNVAAPGDPVDSELDLTHFIKIWERELMVKAIGPTEYGYLLTQLDDIANPANVLSKQLIQGHTYSLNGKTYRWEGLQGFEKDSLIAYYVKSQYIRATDERLTATGTLRTEGKHSERVDPTTKYVKAWQSFLERYQGAALAGPKRGSNGFGTTIIDYASTEGHIRSLYQYLQDRKQADPPEYDQIELKLYGPGESYNSLGI